MFSIYFVFILLALSSTQAYFVKELGTPVVFTNNNGGGADELQVPSNGEASKLYDAGGHVNAAWWVPYDNIGDLVTIHRIEAKPSGNHVNLVVAGHAGQRNGRVRLKIFADVN